MVLKMVRYNQNCYFSGPIKFSGIVNSPFYWTEQNRYFHLKMGAELAAEIQWSRFRILTTEIQRTAILNLVLPVVSGECETW
jgi:hypothetical protein